MQENPVETFKSILAQQGFHIDEIIADGQLHRISVNGKKDKSGWYVFHVDGVPAGAYGDWRSDWSENWSSKSKSEMTDEEWAEQQQRLARAKQLRKKEIAKRHAEAKTKAQSVWKNAKPAPDDHPYLARKNVKSHGTMVDASDILLVPVYRFTDSGAFEIWGIQEILGRGTYSHGGNKKFLPGTKKRGGFFTIGNTDGNGTIYFVEGFATGGSVNEATGDPVVVCFDAGNFEPVIQQWRALHPNREFVIAGDDDRYGPQNVGREKALAAGEKYACRVVFPKFTRLDTEPTDFNDLAVLEGIAEVRRQLTDPKAHCQKAKAETDADPDPETANAVDPGEREAHAQILIRLASDGDFFHDADGRVFVRMKVDGHHEYCSINSSHFKQLITHRFYKETGGAPSSEGFKGAKGVLEARGRFDGGEYETSVRVAAHDESIFLDLTNSAWQAVEIRPDGWEIKQDHPVRFIRAQGMRPLPTPKKSEDTKAAIGLLRKHLNVDDEGFILVVAWLVQALRPIGPYPVLAVTGEHGSAKSTFSSLIRQLVDPNKSPLRSAPSTERDLAIACSNSRAVVFDNLSGLSGSLSDALCRVSTGGGFSTRQLYTDDEERLFNYMRPIILNGITTFIYRSDLADRTITVDLKSIPEENRRPESKVYSAFEQDAPIILGGLLDAVSVAMKNIDSVSLPSLPRMADFALWIQAAEPSLPWESGRFQEVFAENRASIVEASLEGDLFGNALVEHLRQPGAAFVGTASELLRRLERHVGEEALKKPEYKKFWPQSAKAAGRALKRLAPFLRRYGFEYDYDLDRRPRTHIIRREEKAENK